MKLIDQSHKIEYISDLPLQLIERAGRTCYRSEDKICPGSAERFTKMILGRHHESVIEHSLLTVRFITNRGVTHELVRHRLCSFCLSGDTEIHSFPTNHKHSSKKWTVKDLFAWQSDPKRRSRLGLIRLRSVDSNMVLVPNKIVRVLQSGVKPLLRMRTESGRQIKASKDHLFLTPDGWVKLEDIRIGSTVYANGIAAKFNREWVEHHYIEKRMSRPEVAKLMGVADATLGKYIRNLGIKKPLSLRGNRKPGRGVKGMFSDEAKKRISERMTGDRNHRWLGAHAKPNAGRLRAIKMYDATECECCGQTRGIERHHKNENPHDNSPENIKRLCPKCHKAWHFGGAVKTVFRDRVVSVEECPPEMTYDVEMAAPNHNFSANGLIVHNSQESTRYCNYGGKEMEFIRPVWFMTPTQEALFTTALESTKDMYNALLATGQTPQQAREVLPNALKTEIVMSANFRNWRHVLKERTSKAAHPQMRALMLPLLDELKNRVPVIFDDIDGGAL